MVNKNVNMENTVRQFLTIKLGQEEYGLDILKVQEVTGSLAITPVPNSSAHVKGIMNLRGSIIPVVDIRTEFGVAHSEQSTRKVIVVVMVGPRVIGLEVDAVCDVLSVPAAKVQPPPQVSSSEEQNSVSGLLPMDDRIILLLDVNRLLEPTNSGCALPT